MFLRRFEPSAIDPLFLVNRASDLEWLVGAISDYLVDPDTAARRSLTFCILGDKGVGKTILTRAALHQARVKFSDRAIFVEADCRDFRTAKEAIGAIARNVVAQLDDLRLTRTAAVSNELMSTAQALVAIARFEDVELKVVHQHLEQFKAATALKGKHSLLKLLTLDFQISQDLSISTSRELSGMVRFDEVGLCRALKALFEDIRANDIDVVLYLDNMDELSHHYRTVEDMQKVRRDTEVLLLLHEAPIIFIVNMRTYYSGILPREITNRRNLGPLPERELGAILVKRLERDSREEIKNAVAAPALQKAVAKISAIAPTPLAFLTWFKVLFEADALAEDKLSSGVTSFLESYYSTLPVAVWRRVVGAFSDPKSAINREALLRACDGNEAEVNQVIDRQGVLPKDFWDPATYYTLDPELFIVHSSASLDKA